MKLTNFSICLTGVLLIFSAGFFNGCAKSSPNRYSRLSIVFPSHEGTSSRTGLFTALSGYLGAPDTAADFTCLGVNVTGAEIPSATSIKRCMNLGTATPYIGVYGGLIPVTVGGEIEVSVPTGLARRIEVLALKATGKCPTLDTLLADQVDHAQISNLYNIGSAVADVFTDTTVSIKSSWDSLNPKPVFCDTTAGQPKPFLAFTSPPNAVTAGTPFSMIVTVQGTDGLFDPTATNSITLKAYTDDTCQTQHGSNLSGTTTLSASAGIATFSGISFSSTGTIYIGASAVGVTSVCSPAVAVSAGAATKVLFKTIFPSTVTVSTVPSPQPDVAVTDTSGNTVTSANNSISLSAYGSADSTCTGAVVSGALSAAPTNAVNGIAAFSGASFLLTGTYYVGAQSAGLTLACGGPIAVSAGAANKLSFTTQPSSTGTAGTALSQQPVVTIQDSGGNTVTSATDSVTLSAYTDSGCSTAATNAPLVASATDASSGVVAFSGVYFKKTGPYYLKADSGTLTSDCTSSATTISAGMATKLGFTTQPPGGATPGTAFGTNPVVAILDTYDNVVDTEPDTAINLSVYLDGACTSTTAPGTLTPNSFTTTTGSATLSGLQYSDANTTIYLRADGGGHTFACSNGINMGAAVPTKIALTGPTKVVNGKCSAKFTITAQDNSNNPANVGAHTVITMSWAGSGAYFSDPFCATGIGSSVTIPLGNSTASFYLKPSADNAASALSATGIGSPATLSVASATPGTTVLSQMGLGAQFGCLRASDNAVKCWGKNDVYGQLGDNSFTSRSWPYEAYNLGSGSSVIELAVGGNHACVRLDAFTVKCWGEGTFGQLGNGTYTTYQYPYPLTAFSPNVANISAGFRHTCAVNNTAPTCWGDNQEGQIGNGSSGANVKSPSPAFVAGGIGTPIALSEGVSHTCALMGSPGAVKCWGKNSSGQLGDNYTSPQTTPVDVSGITTATAISAGYNHTCAVLSDQTVQCWGANTYGQLGDGTTTNRFTPVAVVSLTNVASVSAGGDHTCALIMSTSTVKCWGKNNKGQLGNNSTTDSLVPVQVTGYSGFLGVTAGFESTCGWLNSAAGGGGYCWGANTYGELGNSSTVDSPVPVSISPW